jgi:lipopolysaccharide/colanic/teichoic acid biosynthesis glycosyltransferase
MKLKHKRPLDLFIITSAHIFPPLTLLWLCIWIAVPIAIWLQDRGPIFYTQERLGKDGRVFLIHKFRTMIPDAESMTGAIWSHKYDNRITKVGKLLRWTALDELPQIWNILKGDMTFVGPRSERPELHKQIIKEIPDFEKRLQVKPGLTGLAQVKGSYDLSPEEKLYYDLKYIKEASIRLDIKIILCSIWNTLLAKWSHPTTPHPPKEIN